MLEAQKIDFAELYLEGLVSIVSYTENKNLKTRELYTLFHIKCVGVM